MTEVLINGSQGKLQGFYKHSENSSNVGLILHPRKCSESSMDNNIVSSLFESFSNNNFSTLKINFRGVQKSEGEPEEDGLGELSDAATALDWLQEQNEDANSCWIGGIDFAIAIHEFSALLSYVVIALHVGASLYSRYKGEGLWNAMVPVWKETGKVFKPISLLSQDGFFWVVSSMVDIFINFPPFIS